MATYKLGWGMKTPGQEFLSEKTLTGDSYTESVFPIPIATDTQVFFAIDVSRTLALMLFADQDMTLETNNTGPGDNAISLKANIPYVWCTNWYDTYLLTVDVVSIYVTSAAVGTLTIRHLYDGTL